MATARRTGTGLTIFICVLLAMLEGYDIQAFGVAAPQMAGALGLGPGQVGNAATIGMVGLVIGAFLGGWLADKVGRKPVLLGSAAAFGVFSIVTAMSQNYDMLLAARFLTGLGFGGAMPNMIAIATEISPPNRRAVTVTTLFCGMPAGGAAVALFAKLAGEAVDWRELFMIGGVLPLVVLPLALWLLPETRPEHPPEADRSLAKALFGEGRALSTLLLWTAFILTLLVIYLMLNWLPTLVVDKGFDKGDGATASFVFNLASIVGATLLGLTVDRVGYRWPLMVFYAVLVATMYGLGRATGLGAILALSGLAGFLVIAAQYALYAFSPTLYPPQVKAFASGAAVAVGRFGSIFGPLVAGQLKASGASSETVFFATIPAVAVAGLAVLALTLVARPAAPEG